MRALFAAASLALVLAACSQPAQVAQKHTGTAAEAAIPEDASQEEIKQTGDERTAAAAKALVGLKGPALELKTIDGRTVDLGELYGRKPVYLKFWATWCVPCREQMPHFEHAFETLGQDVEVVAVNTNFNETLDGVRTYQKRHGLKMPMVMDDGRLASALNLRVTPTHVLIDRTGHIAYVGHSADAKLDSALESIRSQPAVVATPQDRAAAPDTAKAEAVATMKGETFAFRDPAGARTTTLVFFTPWCEDYLKDSQPTTSAQCRSAREEAERLAAKGERLIGVASGLWSNVADVREYEARYRVGIPLALDRRGEVFRTFRVDKIPTVVVLDPQGKEIRRLTGDVAAFARPAGAKAKETSS